MHCRRRSRLRRGFIELRSVVAIMVILSILPIIVSVLTIISNYKIDYDFVNDEISLFQLRRIMLISYDVNNNYDSLNFIYHGKDFELSTVNNRLVLQPGYQVFLNNIDYANFSYDDGLLNLTYGRNGNEQTTCIYKEKGIYIDDFSNTNDDLDSSDVDTE